MNNAAHLPNVTYSKKCVFSICLRAALSLPRHFSSLSDLHFITGNNAARPAHARASAAGLRSPHMKSDLASPALSSPYHIAPLPESAPNNSRGTRLCSEDSTIRLCANRDKHVNEKVERTDAVVKAESRVSPTVAATSNEEPRVKLEPEICKSETTRSATELGNRKIVSNSRSRKTSSLLSLPAPASNLASSHR